MKIKTYCPKFSGFYNSIWEFNYSDIEWSLFDDPHSVPEEIKRIILDDIFDYVDNSAYENAIAKAFVENIGCLINDLYPGLLNSIKFEAVISPKTYNFSTDSINITIDCDLPRLIAEFRKHPKAADYIKATYTSCSGFISYFENDLNDWLKTVEEDIEHKAGSMLELLLDESTEYDLYEAVKENVYEMEFIDYDRLIENINEHFGISIEKLSDLENFEQTHGVILLADEREFLARLYGTKAAFDRIQTKADLIPRKFPELCN